MSDAKAPMSRADPPTKLPDHNKTSDLLGRLQSFMPKMEAANLALSGQNPPRVDLELRSENDDEDGCDNGDVSDDDEKNITKDDAGSRDKNPTIQIEFALGKVEDNPMMEMLADKDLNDDGERKASSDDDESKDDARQMAISSLLLSEKDGTTTEKEPAKKKKPLITELS